jgi:hypothetical protein
MQGVYIIRWDFNDFFYVSCFFPLRKISATMGALQSQNGKNQVKIEDLHGGCYVAVFSNSPIDDNILIYLALRSLLFHNYFLSFDTCKKFTFCFDLDLHAFRLQLTI